MQIKKIFFRFFPVLFWEWKPSEERKPISPIFSLENILGGKLIVEFSKLTRIVAIEMWSGKNDLGRVSSDDNYRVYSHGTRSQHEHSFMNFNGPTRE